MYLVSATPTKLLIEFLCTQPADVHEGIPFLSEIPKFEHHSIANGGGYHSVRSLTVLVSVYLDWSLAYQ